MLNGLRCQLTYLGQAVTNAEAWFNIALHPRKPEGSLGRTAQDGHLDSHTAPELYYAKHGRSCLSSVNSTSLSPLNTRPGHQKRQVHDLATVYDNETRFELNWVRPKCETASFILTFPAMWDPDNETWSWKIVCWYEGATSHKS